jgi:phosphoenolpyruvate-protein kinase (PTS system EI component)
LSPSAGPKRRHGPKPPGKNEIRKEPTAVLVAGGFHTEGFTQLLRQKDISYAVVTPKVNGTLPDGHRTLELLARDPAPLEKLFAGETINIPTQRMVAIANISDGGAGNGLASKLATLLVAIVLGLSVQSTQVSLTTPANFPEQIQAKAVPTSAGVNVSFAGGREFFMPTHPLAGSISGYQAEIPGYGIVSVRPVPKSKPFKAIMNDTFSSLQEWPSRLFNGSQMGWAWLMGILAIGTRRVARRTDVSPVEPVKKPIAPFDSTTTEEPGPPVVLSERGILMSDLENLLGSIPVDGVQVSELISNIRDQRVLGEISEERSWKVINAISGVVAENGLLTRLMINELMEKILQEKDLEGDQYYLQKPSTFALLKTWREQGGSSLKRFMGRHDILGTSIIEEFGIFEKWSALWEGRIPAAFAGVGVGIFAVVFSLSSLQIVGIVIGGTFLWSVIGPQKKFVLDHGIDQTRLQRGVRTGGTFFLNLVAISVSVGVFFVGGVVGLDGLSWGLVALSPAVGLIGSVITHALSEILDILPDATPSKKTFPNDSINQEVSAKDPLGTPLTFEQETEQLIERFGGMNIVDLNGIYRAVADHDLGGSVNDRTGKQSIGVLGDSRSVDVVRASKGFSPYWWQRFWIRQGVLGVNGGISKGPGGDDYKMFYSETDLLEKGESVVGALSNIVDEENDVMRDQFNFYFLEGPKFENGEKEEIEFLASIIDVLEKELNKSGRMSIVRHGNGVTIAVKKDSPDEELISIEANLDRLGAGSQWRRLDVSRPGLGLFTYSMGGLRLGDVVQRLTQVYPELELLDDAGNLRPDKVPVVMMWADRLAEDMLAVAKGRGRKQVFIADNVNEIISHERPGTVTQTNIQQTLSEDSGSTHEAFKAPKAEEFWKALRQETTGRVLVFEVAQYREQGLRWGVNVTSEWVLRHLPSFMFRFVPERWVRGLEKRVQSRAFHSWQGSDQHGKGNDAIKEHYEMVGAVVPEAILTGRAVDTFMALSRAPPSVESLNLAITSMRKKLGAQHPDEKKLNPFHVVYDLDLGGWNKYLTDKYPKTSPGSEDSKRARLSLEDVVAMQNAVVTYLGRRNGVENLIQILGDNLFDVESGPNALLLKFDPSDEKLRKLELLFRKAQAENAKAAELVLNARAPIRLGSTLFSLMAKGVERVMTVSPARARQIVSGRYIQSLLVPMAELPFLPYLSVGFSLVIASVLGPWVGIIAGSFLMALIHGKPVMTRGPPESLSLLKDRLGRPIESRQTLKQFTIRFLAALAINTFAIFVGGLDPTLLFTPQSLTLDSLNFWTTGLTGYLSHSLHNFLVPESYRLSMSPTGDEYPDGARDSKPSDSNASNMESDLAAGGELGLDEILKKIQSESTDWREIKKAYADSIGEKRGVEVRQKFLHIIDDLPFVMASAKGSWMPDQPELFMKALVQELRLSQSGRPKARRKGDKKRSKSGRSDDLVVDADLMEYVFFYSRSLVQGMLKEKREAYEISKKVVNLDMEEKTLVMKSVVGIGTLAARLGWSLMATDITNAGMELWRPEVYHRTRIDYDKRMGTDENGRRNNALEIKKEIETALRQNYKVVPRFDSFTNNRPEAFASVRAKDIFSLMSKLLREGRKGRSYGLDKVEDLFSAKIVLPDPSGLQDWEADVALLLEKIGKELGVVKISDYDVRDLLMGGATYVTLWIKSREGGENRLIPVELQFFSRQRFLFLERMAGVGGAKTKPYWIYKAKDFFENIFSDGEKIELSPTYFILTDDWRNNLSKLSSEWSSGNVVQVRSGEAVQYLSLPGNGENSATFIDLAALTGLVRWESQACLAPSPSIIDNGNSKTAALESVIPTGAVVEWGSPVILTEQKRGDLRSKSKLLKTSNELTNPQERESHLKIFDSAFDSLASGLAQVGSDSKSAVSIINPLFLFDQIGKAIKLADIRKKLDEQFLLLANEHQLSLDEFKAMVVSHPDIISPVFGQFDEGDDSSYKRAPETLIKAREKLVSFVDNLLKTTGGRNFFPIDAGGLLDLLLSLGVVNQQQVEIFQEYLFAGTIVTRQRNEIGTRFVIKSKDRPGLFNLVMKYILRNNGKLVSAFSTKGRLIEILVEAKLADLEEISKDLQRIPLKGGGIASREIQVELTVEFPHGGQTERVDLTSLTGALSRLFASLGGNIQALTVSTDPSSPSIRFVVDMTAAAYERLIDSNDDPGPARQVQEELLAVQGEIILRTTELIPGSLGAPYRLDRVNLFSSAALLGGVYGSGAPIFFDPIVVFGAGVILLASGLVWFSVQGKIIQTSSLDGIRRVFILYENSKNRLESLVNTLANGVNWPRLLLGVGGFAVLFGFPLEAFGATAVGDVLSGLGNGGALGIAGFAVFAVGLGMRKVVGKGPEYFVGSGGTNGVKRIEFGLATHLKSLVSDGEVMHYVSYSLQNPGDTPDLVAKKIGKEKNRLTEAYSAVSGYGIVKASSVLKDSLSRIETAKINAQTAVVETLDQLALLADSSSKAEIQGFKKDLLNHMIETHSLNHLGLSGESLEREKRVQTQLLERTIDRVSIQVSQMKDLQLPEDSTDEQKEQHQSVIDLAVLDEMLLDELKKKSMEIISSQGQTAFGAVRNVLEEVIVDQNIDEKLQESQIQIRNLYLSVLAELQERISPEKVEAELARFSEALERNRSGGPNYKNNVVSEFIEQVHARIREGWSAESSIIFAQESLGDKNREGIGSIISGTIEGLSDSPYDTEEGKVVLVAEEIPTPLDLFKLLNKGVRIVGIVSRKGNLGSHVSIVAASYDIPCLTGFHVSSMEHQALFELIPSGALIAVNGPEGQAEINPSRKRIESLVGLHDDLMAKEEVYYSSRFQESPLAVLGSPDNPKQVKDVIGLGGAGVGLIRTEFDFDHENRRPLDANGNRNPEFENYQAIRFSQDAEAMKGETIDNRVIDNQGPYDKPMAGVSQREGGQTGIDYILYDKEGRVVALQEIRAIIRAYQTHKNIRMFFPLVSTNVEANEILKLIKDALNSFPVESRSSLELPPIGWMIETPAGAINAANDPVFLKTAAFINFGTTDLTKFYMGKGRNAESLGSLLSSNQPIVIDSIHQVLKTLKISKSTIDVTLCGALASSRVFWPVAYLLNDTYPVRLSVPPSKIPEVKYFLRKIGDKREELDTLRKLLNDKSTTAEQLTAECQKIVDQIDKGTKKEKAYKAHMAGLRTERLARVVMGVVSTLALVGVFVVVSSIFPTEALAAGTSIVLSPGGFDPILSGAGTGVFGFVLGSLTNVRIALLRKWLAPQKIGNSIVDYGKYTQFKSQWKMMFPSFNRGSHDRLGLPWEGFDPEQGRLGVPDQKNLQLARVKVIVDRFSAWEFDSTNPNKTQLRTRFLEMLRFRDDLQDSVNNGDVVELIHSMGNTDFSLQSLDDVIEILAGVIGEENYLNAANAPQRKKKSMGIDPRVEAFIEILKSSPKDYNDLNAAYVLDKANEIVKSDSTSLIQLLYRLNNFIPSNKAGANPDVLAVLIKLRRWIDATRIVMEANQLFGTAIHWNTTFAARKNALISKYGGAFSKDRTNVRTKQNLLFIKNLLNRKKPKSSALLTSAMVTLRNWDISNPLPVKMTADNVEIIDLDALAEKTDLSLSQGMPKQGGFLGFPLLLAGLLVSVVILTFFLTGSTFGVEAGGASLVNLAELEKILYVLVGVTAGKNVIDVAQKSSVTPGNSPYTKTINAALQGIPEEIRGDLTPDHVQVMVESVISEKPGSSLGYFGNRKTWVKEEGERLRVLIGREFIADWASKEDNKFNRRKKGVVLYAGYLYTVLQTVFLSALAVDHKIPLEVVRSEGLSVDGVDNLFKTGVGALEIRKIQLARFQTLRASFIEVSVRSNQPQVEVKIDAESIFPVNQMPLDLSLTLGNLIGDGQKGRLRDRLVSLVDNQKGNNETLASELKVIAGMDFGIREEFRPNPLAVAMNNILLKTKPISLKHARLTLARSMLNEISNEESFKSLEQNSNKVIWRILAMLFGMNGSLSEGLNLAGRSDEDSSFVRRIYQQMDLKLFANISSSLSDELQNGPDHLAAGVEAFNQVSDQASLLRDPHTAVAEFLKGGDIVFFISPAMAQGLTPLTPAERTMLDTITLLDRRLNDAADSEANTWRDQGHRVVLGVLDPSNGTVPYAQETVIAHVEKLTGTERVRGDLRALRSIALQVDVFEGTQEGIYLKDKFTQLNLKDANVFALEAPDLNVDYSDLKGLISLLTFALSGGLLCRASVGDSLKAIRAVRISA